MIRVAVVDDQELVRAGFRMILETQPDMQVVGEASDGAGGLRLVSTTAADVLLMDIRMPGVDGLTATRQITRSPNPPRVVVLTTFDTDENVYGALRAGAAGFMLKTVSPSRLIEGIRLVADGEALLAPEITRRLIEQFVQSPPPASDRQERLGQLTPRERDVLTLIGRGRSNQQIAGELVVSPATVKTHINRLFAKLDLPDRVQAVVLAYETGLVRPGEDSR